MKSIQFGKKSIVFSLIAFATLLLGSVATSCSDKDSDGGDLEEASPLWEAGSIRNKIVTISDLHIGIDDSYTETKVNRPMLIEFLKRLHATKDVRELVIVGDFLDAWYLPVYYPSYTDEEQFYKGVIANNQEVIEELKHVIKSGIKLVYVPGNHDMTLDKKVLAEAIPGIVQISDTQGLGTYYTGDRKEIAIEHGHRYDVFSAPDRVTNKALCGNNNTILPAGYFYARYAATWVIEGKPSVKKKYPVVTNIPDQSNADQYGAYVYYLIISSVSAHLTPNEDLNDKIFKMHIAGFNDEYTYLDFYPQQQAGDSIYAKLYKNIQRTWAEREQQNNVKKTIPFITAVQGTLNWSYYFNQAKTQYIENTPEKVDIVVFGHTHVPVLSYISEGKYYINDGTWVDNNSDFPQATRTFAVITTGEKDAVGLYMYEKDGKITDIGNGIAKK